jgi:hypothetical protein
MKYGVHQQLEAEANRLLAQQLAGVTRHADKADILTPWKHADRLRREVFVPSGTPDPAARRGMFHRRINTAKSHLNSRDGRVAPARQVDPLHQFVRAEQVADGIDLNTFL